MGRCLGQWRGIFTASGILFCFRVSGFSVLILILFCFSLEVYCQILFSSPFKENSFGPLLFQSKEMGRVRHEAAVTGMFSLGGISIIFQSVHNVFLANMTEVLVKWEELSAWIQLLEVLLGTFLIRGPAPLQQLFV